MYYDEALTMSVRLAAFTSPTELEKRYGRYKLRLDDALAEITRLSEAAGYDVAPVEETDAANAALVAMELRAFDLLRAGKTEEARALLFGKGYETQKRLYSSGIGRFSARLNATVEESIRRQKRRAAYAAAGLAGVALFTALAWAYAFRHVRFWKRSTERANREAEDAKAGLRESLERLSLANDELERFNYVAAHDLKEPLRTMHSFAQLIEKKNADPETQQYLDCIKRSCTRMRCLVDDLLSFSKISKAAVKREEIDFGELLEYVARENLGSVIAESGARVTWERMPVLQGDRMTLIRIFQNLIGNGVKYNRSPVPEVRVRATEGATEWTFRVSDNGIGVPPEYRERVFALFSRLHDRREYGGAGIGLAICRKALDHLGGRIWAEGEEGGGSAFCFTLPKGRGLG